jgi:hypothetical protein
MTFLAYFRSLNVYLVTTFTHLPLKLTTGPVLTPEIRFWYLHSHFLLRFRFVCGSWSFSAKILFVFLNSIRSVRPTNQPTLKSSSVIFTLEKSKLLLFCSTFVCYCPRFRLTKLSTSNVPIPSLHKHHSQQPPPPPTLTVGSCVTSAVNPQSQNGRPIESKHLPSCLFSNTSNYVQ